jgi:hypothetical protein
MINAEKLMIIYMVSILVTMLWLSLHKRESCLVHLHYSTNFFEVQSLRFLSKLHTQCLRRNIICVVCHSMHGAEPTKSFCCCGAKVKRVDSVI